MVRLFPWMIYNRRDFSFYVVVNGGYSQWSSWATCPVTCGTGTTIRTRTCTDPAPANGGLDCATQGLGVVAEYQLCSTGVLCPGKMQ